MTPPITHRTPTTNTTVLPKLPPEPPKTPTTSPRSTSPVDTFTRTSDTTPTRDRAIAKPHPQQKTIDKIVGLVGADASFQKNVDSPLSVLGGKAGGARNLGKMLSGQDPSTPEVNAKLCTGISEQARGIIVKAMERGELPEVAKVSELERRSVPGRNSGAYHTAVELELKDGSRVVLDWHATLDSKRPKISDRQSF